MKTLTLALVLISLPLNPALAQEMNWQLSGFEWSGAVDLSVDVDGDGLADAIIGDQLDGNGGRVSVHSGANGALLHTITGPVNADYGKEVVGISDLNGDGHDEFGFNGTAGGLSVHDGQTGAELRSFTAGSYETRLSSIGDVNGDGYVDIVVSYPGLSSGVVELVSGRYMADGTQPPSLWIEAGGFTSGRFGEAISSIADVDGDGIDEVIVGAPEEDGVSGLFAFHGQIHCLSGATGAYIWTKKYYDTVSTRFGGAVAGTGDVNGDGVEDVLAGAPWNDSGAIDAGAVFVLSGVHGGFLEQLYNNGQGDLLGSEVSSAGDVDQDGTPDHLFGGEGIDNSMGGVRLYSGATMNLITQYAGHGFLGQPGTLSGGVDATGDGVSDFLISSPGGGFGIGRVQLWRAECTGGHQAYCNSTNNSSGQAATIHIMGIESISMNEMVLEARRCPPNRPGLFYYGTTPIQAPFGDGFRCAGGATRRLYPIVAADNAGFAQFQLDFTAAPLGQGPGMVEPGDTRYFQFWFRDQGGPGGTGFNLTNGQQVTFCQ